MSNTIKSHAAITPAKLFSNVLLNADLAQDSNAAQSHVISLVAMATTLHVLEKKWANSW